MQTFPCSCFHYLTLDNAPHSCTRIARKTSSRTLFRAALYIYYKVIHARLKRRVLLRFVLVFLRARARASRRTLRKLQHYRPKFAQPGLPIVTSRASAFSSMFESQKSELSRRVLSFSPSLLFYSLDGEPVRSCFAFLHENI